PFRYIEPDPLSIILIFVSSIEQDLLRYIEPDPLSNILIFVFSIEQGIE
ncbi:unnamed protein product, partial [Rotaria magnacalcarata]